MGQYASNWLASISLKVLMPLLISITSLKLLVSMHGFPIITCSISYGIMYVLPIINAVGFVDPLPLVQESMFAISD